ncbi:hypothetical protein GCM10009828_097920 [Actinoplanes couchii]
MPPVSVVTPAPADRFCTMPPTMNTIAKSTETGSRIRTGAAVAFVDATATGALVFFTRGWHPVS